MAEIFGEIKLVVSVKTDEDTYRKINNLNELKLVGKRLDLYDVNGNKIGEAYIHDEDTEWDDVVEDEFNDED